MTQRLFLNKDLEASHVGDLQVWGDKGLLSPVAKGQNSRGLSLCGTHAVIGKFK